MAPIPRWLGDMMINAHQISAVLSGSCCGEELNFLSPIRHSLLHIFPRFTAMIGTIVKEEYDSSANWGPIELVCSMTDVSERRHGGGKMAAELGIFVRT